MSIGSSLTELSRLAFGRIRSARIRPAGVLCGLLVVLTASTLTHALLPAVLRTQMLSRVVSVSDIRPEIGLAYVAKLSDPELSDEQRPTPALLYAVQARRGGFIHRFSDYVGETRTITWLKLLYEARFPEVTYEASTLLGPASSLHADIREKGDGRYSVWKGHVYFSLPPGLSFAALKRMELRVPVIPALSAFGAVERLQSALQSVAVASALAVLLWIVGMALVRLNRKSAMLQNVIPGVAITLLLAIGSFAGMEIYLRATGFFGKDQNSWPASYVPGIGMLFQPGEELRHTNGLEFAVSQRANSLGFLDWEPKIPKPPGTFRILLVGDSMIEAVQVAMEQKVQSQLAKILGKRYPRQKVDVVAMGFSGTGQSNQLPYFQFYKERVQADLIVLFFAANDFSNNSILLESIRYGWPAHNIPFLFLEKDHAETCKRLPLPSSFTTERTLGGTYSERVKLLRRTSSAIDVKLGDWDPDKMHIDSVFFEDVMPPAFEEAVELTKCSFQMWKQEADGIGVPILVVATQHVTGYGLVKRPPKTGQIDRLRTMLSQLQIPLLDLYQATAASGDWLEARWKYDGHWNPVGHRWAANALSDYLSEQGYLERPDKRAASAP